MPTLEDLGTQPTWMDLLGAAAARRMDYGGALQNIWRNVSGAREESAKAAQGLPFDPGVTLGAASLANVPAPTTVGTLGTLYLRRDPYGGGGSYRMLNELGHDVGPLRTSLRQRGRQVYVDWIGNPDYEAGANALGLSDTRSLLRALRAEYPSAETIGGFRVSGARYFSGSGAADAEMRLPRMSPLAMERYQAERAAVPGVAPPSAYAVPSSQLELPF